MSWEMLRGVPGILKVVTLILGLISVVFLAFLCSRPYEPVQWYNMSRGPQPGWNKDYTEPRMHVVEDEFCLSIIIILFFVSIIWFVALIKDIPLKDTDLRNLIDMGYHLGAGGLIIIMGIMWYVTVGGRSISIKTYNDSHYGDKDAHETVAAAHEKFGYFNLIFYDFKKDVHASLFLHKLQLFTHRNDKQKFVYLIITGLFIMGNGGVYVAVALLLFFKKGVRVIQRDIDVPKVKINPMFKERDAILKLFTIVFGFFAAILSGTSYAKFYIHQREPMMNFEFEEVHSYGEEIALSLVVIFLGLSIIWLILFFFNIIKDTPLRKKLDLYYHLVGGSLIMLAALLWAVFISLRVFDYSSYIKDSFELSRAKIRAGYVIVINSPGRSMDKVQQYAHSDDERKFLHVVFAGIFILLDGVVYLVLSLFLFTSNSEGKFWQRNFWQNRVHPSEPGENANNNSEPLTEPAPPPAQ